MKQKLILLFLFLFVTQINAQDKILAAVYGDLDNDKIDEKVVVKELNKEGESGKIRNLSVFKRQKSNWILLTTSDGAILESEAGGMMGDPFIEKSIIIKNNILEIYHDGGSSWKWNTTHKYRFQNNRFELIGFHLNYGKLCEYWEVFDCNFSIGKIDYLKETEVFDDDGNQTITKTEKESFQYKLKKPITINDINTKERKIVTPKYKGELYF